MAAPEIDAAIVRVIVPRLYALLDALLAHADTAPKTTVMEARKLLPPQYAHSLQNRKDANVTRQRTARS
jgi:hypothetical protein